MILLFLVSLTFFSPSDGFRNPHIKSAASDAQIKFAIENNYDDTGPGAKGPSAAYKTYNTLEQALVGYLDDPDTKLPESEKQKLLKPLLLGDTTKFTLTNFKPLNFAQKQTPVVLNSIRNTYPHKNEDFLNSIGKFGVLDITNNQNELTKHLEGIQLNGLQSGFQKQKIGTIGSIRSLPPIKLSVFDGAPQLVNSLPESLDIGNFGTRPHYSYSYGVHDHLTGDAKSAHESRDGGRVRGYYTVLDADGQQRTVHYTADDALGFRATVHRTPTLH